jgi:hypothetical protein
MVADGLVADLACFWRVSGHLSCAGNLFKLRFSRNALGTDQGILWPGVGLTLKKDLLLDAVSSKNKVIRNVLDRIYRTVCRYFLTVLVGNT